MAANSTHLSVSSSLAKSSLTFFTKPSRASRLLTANSATKGFNRTWKLVFCSHHSPPAISAASEDNFVLAPSLMEFKMSDFELSPFVNIGLSGKGDEVVYEGVVRNPNSSLKGSKVVLRQLASGRAQRWGKRALQVVTKLVGKQELYHSYATCIHGYILPSACSNGSSLTLVHGYYDSYSLHHWLLREDWLPTLEERLVFDKECARRVGDDRTGGPAVSRQLRLVRIVMRDLLIGVNYLHSHGLAHTELRLQNVHISEVDRHVKVGLLGNAADFIDDQSKAEIIARNSVKEVNRQKLMIAYDIRCAGLMLARMVLKELMDPAIFGQFKSFLTKVNDSSGLREFLLPIINKKSPIGSIGLQILDRDGGAGWHLLSLMLAIQPSKRLSCVEALRHPFLCGPRWRVESSIDLIRWSIGSTAIRIAEEYIYGVPQQNKLAQLIDLLEMTNNATTPKSWLELLPGKWRLVYHTGKQIGLTLRQANPPVLIGQVFKTFQLSEEELLVNATVEFNVMPSKENWPYKKEGIKGGLEITSKKVDLVAGERNYEREVRHDSLDAGKPLSKLEGVNGNSSQQRKGERIGFSRQRKFIIPQSLPVARLNHHQEIDVTMQLDYTGSDRLLPQRVLHEVRIQIPRETFDLTGLVCGTYVDARLLVLRGISGAALLLIRSPSC